MNAENEGRQCGTCAHAGDSMREDPCKRCLKITTRFKGETYPEWEPREEKA